MTGFVPITDEMAQAMLHEFAENLKTTGRIMPHLYSFQVVVSKVKPKEKHHVKQKRRKKEN